MNSSRIQYLLQQYENNNCSREEMEELFHYIRTSKNSNALKSWVSQKYQEIRKHHPSFTYVNEHGVLITELGDSRVDEKKIFRRPRIGYRAALIGLAGFSMLAAFLWLGYKYLSITEKTPPQKEKTLVQKRTAKGENKYLLLPDSTQVWMNVGSVLEFYDDFREDRTIRLVGEAFFKIKSSADLFKIDAGGVLIDTRGPASCNIKAYNNEDEVIVSVSQGKLNIDRGDMEEKELTPGRQLILGKADKSINERDIPVGKISAWQWGEYIYDYAMLDDIVSDLERVFNAKIVVLDPEKKQQKIYVSLRREMGIEDCLARIGRLTNMELHLVGDEYMLGELELSPAP